ncbi:BatA domain-containing protein [Thalassoglobus polymorphus]|uniref:BatA domain-containing protein n=1 Tax=Thalassoglobus polymorphus TaxID=2527994 RepID=UPI00119CCDE4|nr:BatA domain-containing protein [Thalassoglobus polymorphus]
MTNFSLINPGILWGLLALAIPVAIHFLLKRQPRIEFWGASRFLKVAVNRKHIQLQVQSISQLLVRIAILTLLVLSAAEPHLGAHLDSKNVDTPVHRLLILDTSMSMSATDGGRSRFDELQRQVLSTLSNRFPGDSWQLLLHGNNDQPDRIRIPVYDPEAIQEEVTQLTTTSQSASLSETLQRALSYADEFPGNTNEVLFWTDMPVAEWAPSGGQAFELSERLNQLSQLAHLSIIDLSSERTAPVNLAVKEVRLQKVPAKVGAPCTLEVLIGNPEKRAAKTFVQFLSNSEVIAEKEVEFKSQSEKTVRFETVFTNPELKRCEIRIGEDALAGDNHYFFAVPVQSEPRVLVIEDSKSSPEAFQQSDFLRLAISPTSESRPAEPNSASLFVSVGPTGFREQSLEKFDVVILAGVSNLTTSDSERLRQFVEAGGGLMISMSDRMSLSQYNERLGPNGANLIPGILEQRLSIEVPDGVPFQVSDASSTHPMVSPFRHHPESGLSTTRIYAYIRFTPSPDQSLQRVVDLDSSDPLIVEHHVGQGRVITVFSSFDIEWGSWVLWPSFLPMMRQAVEHLSFNPDGIVQSRIGKVVPENVLNLLEISSIQNDQGQVIWDQQIGAEHLSDIFDSYLTQPGLYSLKSSQSRSTVQVIARNVDIEESSLKSVAADELLRGPFLNGLNVEIVEDAEMSASRRRTFGRGAESHLSRWLVFSAILLLIVDQLFAIRSQLATGAILGLIVSVAFVLWIQASTVSSVVLILLCMITGAVIVQFSDRASWRTGRA